MAKLKAIEARLGLKRTVLLDRLLVVAAEHPNYLFPPESLSVPA